MSVHAVEVDVLALVLDDVAAAKRLVAAPGGWRTLSERELQDLSVSASTHERVLALQQLIEHGLPQLERQRLASSEDVAAVYLKRMATLTEEVMVVVALDGRNRVVGEFEVARGGRHGLMLTASDVLRPLIRAGASAFIVVHNHPSGSAEPSAADLDMTVALQAAADIVGVPLLDHVVVAGYGGGFTSMLELGVLEERGQREQQPQRFHEAGRQLRASLAPGPEPQPPDR